MDSKTQIIMRGRFLNQPQICHLILPDISVWVCGRRKINLAISTLTFCKYVWFALGSVFRKSNMFDCASRAAAGRDVSVALLRWRNFRFGVLLYFQPTSN